MTLLRSYLRRSFSHVAAFIAVSCCLALGFGSVYIWQTIFGG